MFSTARKGTCESEHMSRFMKVSVGLFGDWFVRQLELTLGGDSPVDGDSPLRHRQEHDRAEV